MILEILETAGVAVQFDGDEMNICCPFCVERGESPDQRFRLGINTVKGVAYDFNCGWRGHGTAYIAKQLARVLGVKLKYGRSVEPPGVNAGVLAKAPVVGEPEGFEPFTRTPSREERRAREYLRDRGVSVAQIVRHRMGYASAGRYAYRILIPVTGLDGVVHGWVGRAFVPGIKPKYLNTPNVKSLWGATRAGALAIVTEGVMDALRVETALLRVRDTVSVCRLGSAITALQTEQLKAFEKIVVFPDEDYAGVRAAQELCQRCAARGTSVAVVVPPAMTGRDPGDMDDEEIWAKLQGAIPWSKSAELELQLAGTKVRYE